MTQAEMQHAFLAALPRIQAHGRVYFRHKRCQDTREDCLAEMVALSWQWWVRLCDKGRNPSQFVSALASFAARAVGSGRRLCGQNKAQDAMSSIAQQRKGFAVGKLPDVSTLRDNPLTDALHDNAQTPPDEQAAFRIDFPDWLASLGDPKRVIAEELMMGERTHDVADRHRLSPGRVSQLRREFMERWDRFGDEDVESEETNHRMVG